jgi:hypothetical protein
MGQIDYKVHYGMQSNFIELKMMTDNTKEEVGINQMGVLLSLRYRDGMIGT